MMLQEEQVKVREIEQKAILYQRETQKLKQQISQSTQQVSPKQF